VRELRSVHVDDYNVELREDGAFLGDRANKKAFQAMLDTCDTPYYVQVDEDMLLHPDAVRRLHASMRLTSDGVDADSADSPFLICSEKLDFIAYPTRPQSTTAQYSSQELLLPTGSVL